LRWVLVLRVTGRPNRISCNGHHRHFEELDGPAVSALRRAIAEVKQRWSDIGWVTKNLLSRASPCFGRHVKPLVLAASATVSTHQSALGPRGRLLPVLLIRNP
jgi:hypothetical protein